MTTVGLITVILGIITVKYNPSFSLCTACRAGTEGCMISLKYLSLLSRLHSGTPSFFLLRSWQRQCSSQYQSGFGCNFIMPSSVFFPLFFSFFLFFLLTDETHQVKTILLAESISFGWSSVPVLGGSNSLGAKPVWGTGFAWSNGSWLIGSVLGWLHYGARPDSRLR